MLKNILVILFGILYVVQGRSVSQSGDIRVEVNDGIITCGKIVCPSGTDHCVASKENDPANASILVRSEICYAKDNKILQQSINHENIDPNNKVNIKIEANANGKTSVSSTGASNGGNINNNGFQPQWNGFPFGYPSFPGFPNFNWN